jgi:outer membrane protein assembly factor BamB
MLFIKNALLVCVLFLLFSCSKNGDRKTTNPHSITSKALVIFAVEISGTVGTEYLYCFNNDRTVRWKKKLPGNVTTAYTAYKDGVLFVSHTNFVRTSSTGGTSFGNLLALDINTGNDLWKISNSNKTFESAVFFNDTLLCVTTDVIFYVSKINPKTGEIFDAYPIRDRYAIRNLTIDGNFMYYVAAPVTNTNPTLISFDLLTETVKWQVPLNININEFSKPAIGADKVFIKNGLGSLFAINKDNGSIAWKKDGYEYEPPSYSNNLVFSTNANQGLFAYNAADGSIKWQWKVSPSWFVSGTPFISGDNIYLAASYNGRILLSLNKDSGKENWNVDPKGLLQYHVVVGKDIYAMKRKDINSIPEFRIMIMDSETGAARDSVSINAADVGKIGVVTSEDKLVYPN